MAKNEIEVSSSDGVIIVITTPVTTGNLSANGKAKFRMTLADGTDLGVHHAPHGTTARALIAAGYDPDQTYTTRMAGNDFDSFEPMRLSAAAELSVTEGEKSAKIIKWKPYEVPR